MNNSKKNCNNCIYDDEFGLTCKMQNKCITFPLNEHKLHLQDFFQEDVRKKELKEEKSYEEIAERYKHPNKY